MLPAAQADPFLALIRKTLHSGQTESFVYQLQTLSGLRHFEGRARPLGTVVNGQATVVFLARDITERLEAESALRESELRFRSLLRDIPSISVQGYQEDGSTTYWNKASEVLYGYSEQEALGKNLLELIIPSEMQQPVRGNMLAMFRHGTPIPPGELRLRNKDGAPVDVFSSHTRIEVPGQAPELFCIDIDISGRKAAEEEARYLAFYDALTRLPNRRLLVDRLEQVMTSSARSGLNAAVLFLDLDDFKTLNDSPAQPAPALQRDAASSIASGRPSRRTQSAAIACATPCANRTLWPGWVATNSWWCCKTLAPMPPTPPRRYARCANRC